MFGLVFKLFPLRAVSLRVATWVCVKGWLYGLNVNLAPADLFTMVLRFLWWRGCFNVGSASLGVRPWAGYLWRDREIGRV